MSRSSSCTAVASVFATGDAYAVDAAVQSFMICFARNFPGMRCVAFGVGVSGLPRGASVEVALQVLGPAALCPVQETDGVLMYRALVATEAQLIVALVRDENCVAGIKTAAALLGGLGNEADVACTAWIAGPRVQQLATILDADASHNWSVMCAHSLRGDSSAGATGSYAAILSIARHRAPS